MKGNFSYTGGDEGLEVKSHYLIPCDGFFRIDHTTLARRNCQIVQSMPSLLKNTLFRISASRSSFVQLITSM